MKDIPSYREMIRQKFQEKFERNPRYSMRSFATHLGVSAPMLSQILSSKRNLSIKLAHEVARKLQLEGVQGKIFVTLVELESATSDEARQKAELRLKSFSPKTYTHLKAEQVLSICDWVHFSILELTNLKDFNSSVPWIARKLKLPEHKVKMAVDRLIEMDQLRIGADGKLTATWHRLAVKFDDEASIRDNFILPVMEKNMETVRTVPASKGRVSANFVAIPVSRLEELKNLIREFEAGLLTEFGRPDDPNDMLYTYSSQFLPFI